MRKNQKTEEIARRKPPPKKTGQGKGPRSFRGNLLDVAGLAEEQGMTQKTIRARVDRGLLPYRKWGGRIVFIRSEIEEFFQNLPGRSADEALRNQVERQGQ